MLVCSLHFLTIFVPDSFALVVIDLEAVLWLEAYLQTYKHTVVVVSHDRGFLNEVCTDIILFQNQKLEYFKGNYDT